jgi:hypothetical protein
MNAGGQFFKYHCPYSVYNTGLPDGNVPSMHLETRFKVRKPITKPGPYVPSVEHRSLVHLVYSKQKLQNC